MHFFDYVERHQASIAHSQSNHTNIKLFTPKKQKESLNLDVCQNLNFVVQMTNQTVIVMRSWPHSFSHLYQTTYQT